MKSFFKTYLLEMLLIWGALGGYYLFPFGEYVYSMENGLHFEENFSVEILFYLATFYSLISIFIMIGKVNKGEESKFLYLLKNIGKIKGDSKAKNILLFFGVKLFFIPLMIPWTVEFAIYIYYMVVGNDVVYATWIEYFNNYLFLLLTYILGFIALLYYSFGYLIESNALDSKVKSVEPTVFGWIVTLICYPLFLTFVTRIIPFYTDDMAFFKNQEITFIVRVCLLLVMSFKIWSIATLGAKCSNLTNRGIVTKGPYKWVRHPHYLAKLVVWWVTLIPALALFDYWIIGTMIFWTVVYVLRALTEENHLKSDKNYVAYCDQVKWRFIPFVF